MEFFHTVGRACSCTRYPKGRNGAPAALGIGHAGEDRFPRGEGCKASKVLHDINAGSK